MQSATAEHGRLWSIVLAGGEGKRMCPLIEPWLKQTRPKQYCSFYGSKSLLENTLERLIPLTGRDRIVTIIGQGHRQYLPDAEQLNGMVVEQPEARGTGPGVFFPAMFIHEQDPAAEVLISPSDHFIFPTQAFVEKVKEALGVLRDYPDRMILIGVKPDGPATEYGWIDFEADTVCPAFEPVPKGRVVRGFVEKPSSKEANHCYSCGHYWNTMIVLAKAQTLWSFGLRTQPDVLLRFSLLKQKLTALKRGWISGPDFKESVDSVYTELPEFDFSRDFIAPLVRHCLMVPLEGVVWSDLGRPDRLAAVIDRMGLKPNFPVAILESSPASTSGE